MAGNHDGEHHDEHHEPLHQAPWVFWMTIALCVGFGVAVLLLNGQPDRPW